MIRITHPDDIVTENIHLKYSGMANLSWIQKKTNARLERSRPFDKQKSKLISTEK